MLLRERKNNFRGGIEGGTFTIENRLAVWIPSVCLFAETSKGKARVGKEGE